MPIPRRAGFTLIEILVVSMVLALIGAMIIPRLVGKSAVTVQLAGEQVAAMLASFASRTSLAGQPVALLRDEDLGTIEVWILDVDPQQPAAPPAWRLDRMAKPLSLPGGISLVEVRIDGQRLVPDAWRVVNTPGLPRPRIELVVASDREGDELTVVLEPRASAPYLLQPGLRAPIGRPSVDLDREGRERELW